MNDYSVKDLRQEFDEVMDELCVEVKEFPWEKKVAYAAWCAQTYYYVCHSTRLLALAGARCDLDKNPYHRRFLDHLNEEKGHEKLCLTDLKNLGFGIDQLAEFPETTLFYQNQYYTIDYKGSLAFFGWILMLEGAAVHASAGPRERITRAHGESASKFLQIHSAEDVEHLQKAFESIEALPPTELQQIGKNLRQSATLYIAMCRKASRAKVVEVKKAA
jgi:hypothetical protein